MFGAGLDGKWVAFSKFRMPVKALWLLETLKSRTDDDGDSTTRSVCNSAEVQAEAVSKTT